jgi:3-dehydroquinate dehydratase / shikimate dehydrogenase
MAHTLLCVPIRVQSVEQTTRDALRAAEMGADIIELRLDDAEGAPLPLRKLPSLPVILTCRPVSEGGTNTDYPQQRCDRLFSQANSDIKVHPAFIDIELETLKYGVEIQSNPPLIVSSHDFVGRPARLTNLVLELAASSAAVVKIVWTARTIRDNFEAFDLLRHTDKPMIALCMGEAGIISRILAPKFGAFLSFASLDVDSGTAPGQISIEQMKRLYRWDAIKPSTKVYGVVAHPVMHSMSPAIHNAAFEQVGHDGVYVPLLVEPGWEPFKAFMESALHCEGLDLSGLSITLPHKENALRYLQEKGAEIEPLALRIGAVNTIVIDGNNLRGFNSDYAAILDSIVAKMRIFHENLKDLRVALLGAGGTGRTAVAALAHYGATIVIYNRTADRARALAEEFNPVAKAAGGKVVAAPMENLCKSCCDVLINTTSVGMYPKINENPLPDDQYKFTPETVVFETIYNPPKTRLLQTAEAAGAQTIGGIEMFVRQAAAQFEAWTGKPAPKEIMRAVIEARLSRK